MSNSLGGFTSPLTSALHRNNTTTSSSSYHQQGVGGGVNYFTSNTSSANNNNMNMMNTPRGTFSDPNHYTTSGGQPGSSYQRNTSPGASVRTPLTANRASALTRFGTPPPSSYAHLHSISASANRLSNNNNNGGYTGPS